MRAYGLIFGLLVVSVLEAFARPVSKYELVSRGKETRSFDQGTASQLTVKEFEDGLRSLLEREYSLLPREPQPGPTTWIKKTWAKTKDKFSRKPKAANGQNQGTGAGIGSNPRPMQTPLPQANAVGGRPPRQRPSFERPAVKPEGPRRPSSHSSRLSSGSASPPNSPRPLPATPPRPLPAIPPPPPPKKAQGPCACGICDRTRAQSAGC